MRCIHLFIDLRRRSALFGQFRAQVKNTACGIGKTETAGIGQNRSIERLRNGGRVGDSFLVKKKADYFSGRSGSNIDDIDVPKKQLSRW